MTLNNLLPNVGNNAEDLASYAHNEDFWTLLVTACFQGPHTHDPAHSETANEGALLKNVLELSPAFVVIFLEGVREDSYVQLNSNSSALVQSGRVSFKERLVNVIAHEIGHPPGNKSAKEEHAEKGLMDENVGIDFTAASIKRFREGETWR